jgi:type VI protein secretion system component VasK
MENNSIVQKIAFIIVHGSSLWFLIGLITASLASWRLAVVLTAHNARDREAELARKTAIAYAIIAVCLWILSWALS